MSGPGSSAAAAAPTTAAATITTTTTGLPVFTTSAPIVATTASLLSPTPAAPAFPTEAFNALTTAIYALQRQMGDISLRLAAVERQPSSSGPPVFQYGLPGYGGIPALPASRPAILELSFSAPPVPTTGVTTTGALSLPPQPPSVGLSITQIPFPHSPSPVPSLSSIMQGGGIAAPPPSNAMHTPPATASSTAGAGGSCCPPVP
ncbi:early nodulin-like protein 18 [Miscanthus floridulus]|uniref:early nodulin-like protein 18 n=1 Tax=Miscanthus floridulus TaxID=154761 RepID=UPI00345B278B